MADTVEQMGFPVNNFGEIVAEAASGDDVVVGCLAAEYIPANTICNIGGSQTWLPLITISDIFSLGCNRGLSAEDADYGDFITLYKL